MNSTNETMIYTEEDYRKAFKEVLVILKYIPIAEYEKIPLEVIENLKEKADDTYEFNLDFGKNLNEQNISEITKAMLENFYRDYWVTDIEKQKIIEEENKEREEIEEEKRQKYNPNDIFKNKEESQENIENKETSLDLIEIKEKGLFGKIIEKIKNLFKKFQNKD